MDSAVAKKRFDTYLEANFGKELKAAGFDGEGRTFRRQVGDIIHCVKVQMHERGGRSGINLGIHLTFLPNLGGERVEPHAITEADCDFRNPLSPEMDGDHWWNHQGKIRSPEAKAKSMMATYFKAGEAFFQHFSTVEAILEDVSYRRLRSRNPERCRLGLSGYTNHSRACLTVARIHRHFGNSEKVQEFAELGLKIHDNPQASKLRDELQELIASSRTISG